MEALPVEQRGGDLDRGNYGVGGEGDPDDRFRGQSFGHFRPRAAPCVQTNNEAAGGRMVSWKTIRGVIRGEEAKFGRMRNNRQAAEFRSAIEEGDFSWRIRLERAHRAKPDQSPSL